MNLHDDEKPVSPIDEEIGKSRDEERIEEGQAP